MTKAMLQNSKPVFTQLREVDPFKPSMLRWARRVKAASPPLFWVGLILLAASMVTAALAMVDPRTFQGVSVWIKPWKFQFSSAAYLLTLALFMVWLPQQALRSKAVQYVVWVAVVTALFEVTYVTLQGALGTASHFNRSTPFLATMYTLMGVGAVLLTSASAVLAWVIGTNREYSLAPATKIAVVLGLSLTFLLGTGFGAYLGSQVTTGHWVGGARTDLGGLPFTNWSRTGGDLRVAHFFGIHAMHFIPFFAAALALTPCREPIAKWAVWAFSIAYAVACTWTFIHARSGFAFLS